MEAPFDTGSSSSQKDKIVQSAENEDSGITMIDVLVEEQELEEDANAVLGGSDDQDCTYPQGYVKRQALYACKTCTMDNNIVAGICLACSYACHEGHELLELYTKRNFCCDCGNGKFPNKCKLYPNKIPDNERNSYNQNFKGTYCTCSRPYPDPEIDDEMIQCIVCEDWYHSKHLDNPVPPAHDYEEMICGTCMKSLPFLWSYAANQQTGVKGNKVEKESDDVVDIGIELADFSGLDSSHLPVIKDTQGTLAATAKACAESDVSPSTSSAKCKLINMRMDFAVKNGATYWQEGWREKLCSCDTCKASYQNKNASFLLDYQDTVHAYEEHGKAKQVGQSQYDQGMKALSQMDRIQQVEAIHEYNTMKTELKDFLKSFAEHKKLVRKEDIDEFFTQMKAKKRKLNVNIPNFCR